MSFLSDLAKAINYSQEELDHAKRNRDMIARTKGKPTQWDIELARALSAPAGLDGLTKFLRAHSADLPQVGSKVSRRADRLDTTIGTDGII